MTPEQFCFWLHGFFELTGKDELSNEQAQMVREHLDLVFTKVTPPLKKNKLDPIAKKKLDLIVEEMEKTKEDARSVLPHHPGPTRIC